MPKLKKDEELFDRMRSFENRTGTARKVSESIGISNRPAARSTIADLTAAVAEIQDRISQGPEKRGATAKKAARTGAEAQG